MSMESAAWSTLYRTMSAQQEKRPFSRVTVRRIATFARPQRTALVAFVALSVVGAFLAIATPILAGRVVEAITQRSAVSVVVKLAVLIAVIAVVEAGVGLVSRWLSARIGENLILDLRRAVFDHVQTMPVAFFTRTRTGALVSRLNNDVIGAQRAFSDTLSGVVGNFVADHPGQGVREGALGADHVVVEPADQGTGAGAGEERDRHRLHVVEDRPSQIQDE